MKYPQNHNTKTSICQRLGIKNVKLKKKTFRMGLFKILVHENWRLFQMFIVISYTDLQTSWKVKELFYETYNSKIKIQEIYIQKFIFERLTCILLL